MQQEIATGSQWRNETHRLDVIVLARRQAVVEIKPITQPTRRAKRCFVPVEDFLRYYRPKQAA